MYAKRTIAVLMAVVMIVLMFSGCGSQNAVEYTYSAKYTVHNLESCVLSENTRLKLSWNNDSKSIALEDKQTGKVWSNVYEGKETSTLDCYVQNMRIFQTEFVSGLKAFENKTISAEKIKNGVKITYYFDKEEIAVPVSYTLREDSMLIAVNGKEIKEKGEEYRLISVTPSPAITSVRQDEPDSYIFVSSGIGALIDTKPDVNGEKRMEIGGANVSSLSTSSNVNSAEASGIRAYGLKAGENAVFCIAEEHAGAVGSRFSAGDSKSAYSSVSAEFYLVDSDYVKGKASSAGDVRLLSDRLQSTVSMGFYPLAAEEADYNGMAKCYRRYLEKKGLITNEEKDFSSPYALTVLGGVMTTSSIMGVPQKTLKKMTGFSEAQEMIESLTKEVGIKPVVRLSGFGESGLNVGKIAGGYRFASVFGKDRDRKALEKACADEKIPLFTEFDPIRFSQSGNGFSYRNDAAKTATLHTAEFSSINIPLRDYNASLSYRLLARNKVEQAIDKLVNMCRKNEVSGICLSFFGSKSYSDHNDIRYGVTGQMEEDAKKGISTVKKTEKAVAGSASTYYAAGLLDMVFDAPLEETGRFQFDQEIPFYQMVFSGITPLYSASLNTASNPAKKLMLAAASGTGIGFSILKDFEKEYMETNVEKLYSCSYEYCKESILDSLGKYGEIYAAVADKKIDRYDFVNEFVTKTVFENGVAVYANHSPSTVQTPVGELEGYGFKMEGSR